VGHTLSVWMDLHHLTYHHASLPVQVPLILGIWWVVLEGRPVESCLQALWSGLYGCKSSKDVHRFASGCCWPCCAQYGHTHTRTHEHQGSTRMQCISACAQSSTANEHVSMHPPTTTHDRGAKGMGKSFQMELCLKKLGWVWMCGC